MALQMSQLGSLGYADVVAAIVGPLATGGADVYRTYEEGRLGRKELKQRKREFKQLSQLYEKQQEAAERQQALAAAAKIRQEQIRSAQQARVAPYLLGAAAIGGLALIGVAIARGGGRGH